MFLQKSQELVTKIDGSERIYSNPESFSQVDLRMTHSCFHRMRAVLASRSQMSCSYPSCFLTVSQHWKYTLESNNLSVREMGWTDCSLCVKLHNQTSHYEPRCSMRRAPSKAFLQNSLLIVTKKSTRVKGESAGKVFSFAFLWVFKMLHSNFHRLAVFLLLLLLQLLSRFSSVWLCATP